MNKISQLSVPEQTKFEKAVVHDMDTKSATSKTTTVIIRVPNNDRTKTKNDLEKKLVKSGYMVASKRGGGSIGTTSISFPKHNIDITYKSLSGGMSETTLNSTITELSPAIAFMKKKKYGVNDVDVEKYYSFLKENAKLPKVYVNQTDMKSGEDFIKSFKTSSKFKEKMKNAIQVTKYLYEIDHEKPISRVYWGYRAKPPGPGGGAIPGNHKGDIFLEFNDKSMLGVSLKAGDEKSSEPQLNTYVQPMLKSMDYVVTEIETQVYNEIHSKIGLKKQWKERGNYTEAREVLVSLSENNEKKYEDYYDQMLELVRKHLVKKVGENKSKTIKFIKQSILAEFDEVPLVVVKATENSWKYLTDEDDIEKFLPRVTKVTAEVSPTSKQDWFIILHTKNQCKLTLKMSVRTNKSLPDNKLQQGFNLAVKFNGTILT
jgi:hypothetical protein|tara:strand:- start:45 stop:1334 length:1290 start_codon:yes stop_codon:yes gene_type:complete